MLHPPRQQFAFPGARPGGGGTAPGNDTAPAEPAAPRRTVDDGRLDIQA